MSTDNLQYERKSLLYVMQQVSNQAMVEKSSKQLESEVIVSDSQLIMFCQTFLIRVSTTITETCVQHLLISSVYSYNYNIMMHARCNSLPSRGGQNQGGANSQHPSHACAKLPNMLTSRRSEKNVSVVLSTYCTCTNQPFHGRAWQALWFGPF